MTNLSRFIFVNSDGDFEESSSEDGLTYSSFRTLNYELDDRLLGQLASAISAFNGATGPDILFSSEVADLEVPLDGASVRIGDSFSIKTETVVESVLLKLGVRGATGGATLTLGIYSNNRVLSSLIATADLPVAVDALSSGALPSVVEFTFTGLTLTPGTYWYVLSYDSPGTAIDGSNCAEVSAYSALGLYESYDGLEWSKHHGTLAAEVQAPDVTLGGSCLVKTRTDGRIDQSFLQYNVNFGGNVLSGVAPGQAATDAATVAQLEALESLVETAGQWYTAAEDLAVGDLVYIFAEDAVAKIADLLDPDLAVGIVAKLGPDDTVRVAANDVKIPGVLGGLGVPGKKYYWNGSSWQEAMPSGSGEAVWLGGVARNANDLHCEVKLIKRNS